jgi:hypothetical protein
MLIKSKITVERTTDGYYYVDKDGFRRGRGRAEQAIEFIGLNCRTQSHRMIIDTLYNMPLTGIVSFTFELEQE